MSLTITLTGTGGAQLGADIWLRLCGLPTSTLTGAIPSTPL
mgnify:CR=1 FL=1